MSNFSFPPPPPPPPKAAPDYVIPYESQPQGSQRGRGGRGGNSRGGGRARGDFRGGRGGYAPRGSQLAGTANYHNHVGRPPSYVANNQQQTSGYPTMMGYIPNQPPIPSNAPFYHTPPNIPSSAGPSQWMTSPGTTGQYNGPPMHQISGYPHSVQLPNLPMPKQFVQFVHDKSQYGGGVPIPGTHGSTSHAHLAASLAQFDSANSMVRNYSYQPSNSHQAEPAHTQNSFCPANDFKAGNKRGTYGKNHDRNTNRQAFAGSQHAPKLTVAPAIPSFGSPLPSLRNIVPSSSRSVTTSTAHNIQGTKRKRTTNQLGLTPQGNEHEASDEEVDEEQAFATKGAPLQIEYKGQVSILGDAAEIKAWIEERKKRWPTAARVELRKQEQAKQRAEQVEARRKFEESRQQKRMEWQQEQETQRRQQQPQTKDNQLHAVRAGSDLSKEEKMAQKLKKHEDKAEKLRKRLAKAERELAKLSKPSKNTIENTTEIASEEIVPRATSNQDTPSVQVSQSGAAGPNIDTEESVPSEQPQQIDSTTIDVDEPQDMPNSNQLGADSLSVLVPLEEDHTMAGTDAAPRSEAIEDDTGTLPASSPEDIHSSSGDTSDSDSDTDSLSSSASSSAPEETTSKSLGPTRVAPPTRTPNQRICRYFAQKGHCTQGASCNFRHEIPTHGLARGNNKKMESERQKAKAERKTLHQRMVEQEQAVENRKALLAIKYLGEHGFFDETGQDAREDRMTVDGAASAGVRGND